MNIFILDNDPSKAAQYHCDKHVVKMILESAQMLSTAHHMIDGSFNAERRIKGILQPTHINHPCSMWAREASANYEWLHSLLVNLLAEYTRRYNRIHKFAAIALNLSMLPVEMGDYMRGERTPFVQCMPEQYKNPRSAVQAYRAYYFGEKREMVTWKTPTPKWWIEKLQEESMQHAASSWVQG